MIIPKIANSAMLISLFIVVVGVAYFLLFSPPGLSFGRLIVLPLVLGITVIVVLAFIDLWWGVWS